MQFLLSRCQVFIPRPLLIPHRLLQCCGVLVLLSLLTGCMAALPTESAPEQSSFRPAAVPPTSPAAVSQDAADADAPDGDPQEPSVPLGAGMTVSESVAYEGTDITTDLPAPIDPQAALPTATIAADPLPTATIEAPAEPTPTIAAPTPEPVSPDAVVELPPLATPLVEQVWRSQQQNREVFVDLQRYYTSSSELYWFDPILQRHVMLGTFSGEFVAQARFTLAHTGAPALEVPYEINQSYGLTSLSPAYVQRIQEATEGTWIETYVLETPDLQPR